MINVHYGSESPSTHTTLSVPSSKPIVKWVSLNSDWIPPVWDFL